MAKKSNVATAKKANGKKLKEIEAKAAAKAKAEAKAAKAKTKALAQLDGIAKRVNAEADKVLVSEKRADDLRVTIAQELDAAKQIAKDGGISFKAWCQEHVHLSYTEAVRLAKIGGSDDPAAALADLRAGNAARNKTARAKKAEKPEQITDQRTVSDLIDDMRDDELADMIRDKAGNVGLKVMAEDFDPVFGGLTALKTGFKKLKASERMTFAEWAAEQVGLETSLGSFASSEVDDDETDEELMEIPASMKRSKINKAA